MLAHSDPTDHALATIASILDHPEPRREMEKASRAPAGKSPISKSPIDKSPIDKSPMHKAPAQTSPSLVPADADGYTKVGPGPIAAIRFKWTVRRADNDDYFVDEMVGENPTPKTSGPMPKEAAVRLVDDREAKARRRFEELRSEMNGRAAGADFVRNGGEA
jgi:hypothetical protein